MVDANGDLIEEIGNNIGYTGNEDSGSTSGEPVFFNSADEVGPDGFLALDCSINPNADGTCALLCTANGENTNSLHGDTWYLAGPDPFIPLVVTAAED